MKRPTRQELVRALEEACKFLGDLEAAGMTTAGATHDGKDRGAALRGLLARERAWERQREADAYARGSDRAYQAGYSYAAGYHD